MTVSRTCPPCNHNCREGKDCPARAACTTCKGNCPTPEACRLPEPTHRPTFTITGPHRRRPTMLQRRRRKQLAALLGLGAAMVLGLAVFIARTT